MLPCLGFAVVGLVACGASDGTARAASGPSASGHARSYRTPVPSALCSLVDPSPVRALARSARVVASGSTATSDGAQCLIRWRASNDAGGVSAMMLRVSVAYTESTTSAEDEYDMEWAATSRAADADAGARKLTGFAAPAFAAWIRLKDAGSVDVHVQDGNLLLKVVLTVERRDAPATIALDPAIAVGRHTLTALRARHH